MESNQKKNLNAHYELADYHNHGFLKVSGQLDKEAVCAISTLIDDIFENVHRYSSCRVKYLDTDNASTQAIHEVNYVLSEYASLKKNMAFLQCKKIASTLLGSRVFPSFDHAIYKIPGGRHVHWHQDDAYKTSVRKMKSIAAWIPLQDTTEKLGCMTYVSGSHKLPTLPHKETGDGIRFVELDAQLSSKINNVEANLGDVIFHAPKTLHSSLPNLSTFTRKAWIVHFSPYGKFEPLLPHNLFFNVQHRIAQKFFKASK